MPCVVLGVKTALCFQWKQNAELCIKGDSLITKAFLCRVLDGTKAVQVFGKVDSALQQLLLPSVLT